MAVVILEYTHMNKMLHLLSSVIFIQFVCISVPNFLPRFFSCSTPLYTVSYGCKDQVDIVNSFLVKVPLSIVILNKFLLILLVWQCVLLIYQQKDVTVSCTCCVSCLLFCPFSVFLDICFLKIVLNRKFSYIFVILSQLRISHQCNSSRMWLSLRNDSCICNHYS